MKITDYLWNMARRDQLRRDRQEMIKKGHIRQASRMLPQMMVRDGQGDWKPYIGESHLCHVGIHGDVA